MSLENTRLTTKVIFTKHPQFLSVILLLLLLLGKNMEMDKYDVKCNAELCPYYFPVNVSILDVVFR